MIAFTEGRFWLESAIAPQPPADWPMTIGAVGHGKLLLGHIVDDPFVERGGGHAGVAEVRVLALADL